MDKQESDSGIKDIEDIVVHPFRPARHWWALGLRGLCILVFGILALAWPGISFGVLVFLFGAVALAAGTFTLVSATRQVDRRHRARLAIQGMVSIVIGGLTFSWPGITAVVLLILIAIWALVTGSFEIGAAFRQSANVGNKWTHVVTGSISVVLGLILIVLSTIGVAEAVLLIGIYALVIGIWFIILALIMRKKQNSAQIHGA